MPGDKRSCYTAYQRANYPVDIMPKKSRRITICVTATATCLLMHLPTAVPSSNIYIKGRFV